MSLDEQTLQEIEKLIGKREKEKIVVPVPTKQEELAKKQPTVEEQTKELFTSLLKQMQQQPVIPNNATPANIVPQSQIITSSRPIIEKLEAAKIIMAAQKNISMLCMMVFIVPIVSVLITMMGFDMIAGIIALVITIYPALLFAQSSRMQAYLAQKYNLKTSFILRQRQPMPRLQQQSDKKKEEPPII